MNKYLTISASTVLLFAGLSLITGCSSSGDGGVAPGTLPATLPANATVIDANNAEDLVLAVSQSLRTLNQALAVETTPVFGLNAALEIVEPFLNHSDNSGANLTTGITDSDVCPGGGSYSDTYTETTNGEIYSVSGTITFVNCIIPLDTLTSFLINGSLTYDDTDDGSTGDYDESTTGSLVITTTTSTDSVKISFTGIDFQESGNNWDYTYTTTKSTFALVVEVNGVTQFAFLTELKAPIVESNGDFCPESGHIFITGGNSTTAEGIYNGDGTMTIKANGAVVDAAAACY